MVAIIVAIEATLVPMASHFVMSVGSFFALVGTMTSQPGSILPFFAIAMVPF